MKAFIEMVNRVSNDDSNPLTTEIHTIYRSLLDISKSVGPPPNHTPHMLRAPSNGIAGSCGIEW